MQKARGELEEEREIANIVSLPGIGTFAFNFASPSWSHPSH